MDKESGVDSGIVGSTSPQQMPRDPSPTPASCPFRVQSRTEIYVLNPHTPRAERAVGNLG
jgi:hypothetical protein